MCMSIERLLSPPAQGHSGEIRDVQVVPKEDKFVSGGSDQRVVLWDAMAHKAIWSGAATSPVNCLSVAPDRSGLVCGLESGALCHVQGREKPFSDVNEKLSIIAHSVILGKV